MFGGIVVTNRTPDAAAQNSTTTEVDHWNESRRFPDSAWVADPGEHAPAGCRTPHSGGAKNSNAMPSGSRKLSPKP